MNGDVRSDLNQSLLIMRHTELIKTAIENCFLISFQYAYFPRLLEPYYLIENQNDEIMLLGYQVVAESYSGREGWREFKLGNVENIKLTEIVFISRNPQYLLIVADIRRIIVGKEIGARR